MGYVRWHCRSVSLLVVGTVSTLLYIIIIHDSRHISFPVAVLHTNSILFLLAECDDY